MTNPKVLIVMNRTFGDSDSVLIGVSRFLRDHGHGGWDLFIDYDARAESEPGYILQQNWDGVISRTTTRRLVDVCKAKHIPLVDINDCDAFSEIPKVRPDNIAIGHMAAEDLHERGLRHLYFCGYHTEGWSNERRDGFFEATRLLGLEPGEFSLPFRRDLSPTENALVVEQIAEWLKTLPTPSGIMAAHDFRGAQILAAAQIAERLVPEEIAVLGVNNEQVRCELAVPPLSSVMTDAFRVGYLAAEELARCMKGTNTPAGEIRVQPVKVVTRGSTDSLVIEDRAISTALGIIRNEACNGITVQEVARRAAIPRARLERGFRFYLGRSPQAEIRRIQLCRIKELLTETDLLLKEIAQLTGFEHVEYLNVSFKRAVGQTPGKYRLLTRKSPGSAMGHAAREVPALVEMT